MKKNDFVFIGSDIAFNNRRGRKPWNSAVVDRNPD